jgi:hypothetical protein
MWAYLSFEISSGTPDNPGSLVRPGLNVKSA